MGLGCINNEPLIILKMKLLIQPVVQSVKKVMVINCKIVIRVHFHLDTHILRHLIVAAVFLDGNITILFYEKALPWV